MKKILATAALPYANADIHIGHMVEHCQLDIWVRAKKMQKLECYSFCADDTHGTPIMLSAKKLGISPEDLIKKVNEQHKKDFNLFGINYDHYSMTHTEENRELVYEIYENMKEHNLVFSKKIEQVYCENCKMFLPDRLLKGTCPKCYSKDQNGDNCDKCGAIYATKEVIDPYCVECKSRNISLKETEHLFFKLNLFKDFLNDWIQKTNDKAIVNKLQEWLKNDLKDWNISRDEPYFGFEIPGTKDKFFYVWVDAPIGYISTTKEWAEKNQKKLEDFWCNDEVEIVHFIGKDIVYFHSLFWPSLLKNTRFNMPSHIYIHGFLTVNGQKMSKSKGTQINVRDYTKHLDVDYFRYYMATKINSSIDDFDFNTLDFKNKINSDLIGKITNLVSRGAQMIEKNFEGNLGNLDEEGNRICNSFRDKKQLIIDYYSDRNFNKITIEIREMAEEVNRYFDKYKPWELIKIDRTKTQSILTSVLEAYRIMTIYITPIIPKYSAKVQKLFFEDRWTFSSIENSLSNKKINHFEHILKRIEDDKLNSVFNF